MNQFVSQAVGVSVGQGQGASVGVSVSQGLGQGAGQSVGVGVGVGGSVSNLSCINAPRGYQSDHFLFRLSLGRTYIMTVPLFTSASTGNVSTFHQDHVAVHKLAFNRINRYTTLYCDVPHYNRDKLFCWSTP